MRRFALVGGLAASAVAGVARGAAAQAPAPAGLAAAAAALPLGGVVRVETAGGVRVTGALRALRADTLLVAGGRGAAVRRVPLPSVVRLRARSGTRAVSYGVVGAVAGALLVGAFAYEFQGLDDSAGACRGLHCAALPGAWLGAALGYGLGAVVGSRRSVWRQVYPRPR